MMFSELRSFEGGRNAGVAASRGADRQPGGSGGLLLLLLLRSSSRTFLERPKSISPIYIFSSCLDISACLLGVPSLQAKGETIVSSRGAVPPHSGCTLGGFAL